MSPGGGGVTGGRASAANLQNAGAASAALTASRAREVLKQTDAAVAGMKALQNNARSLMAAPGLKNGLVEGWLEPKDGFKADGTPDLSSWSGAATVSKKGDRNLVITQSSQNAYLYWNRFNIGPETTVKFDQSKGGVDAGKWIAFNKVMGPVNPSHIYGSITAPGQVYILNQNGILFHNGSQVNVHALVASTLPINENLAGDALKGIKGRGIANNPDSQFLFSALEVLGNANLKTDKFTPVVNGPIGDVTVERGASIISPANANNTGGLVALVGPNVRNEGSISTPNGQTILAAGLQVGLVPHPSSDPSLRGMDVFVGKVVDASVPTVASKSGEARNSGLLSAMLGNVTMAGKSVAQNGVIESSTETDLNGRIDLSAVFNAEMNPKFDGNVKNGEAVIYDYNSENTGLVELGGGSVMRILPQQNSGKTIIGSALALNSVVAVTGANVRIGGGSILLAPGAAPTSGALSQARKSLPGGVTIAAGKWDDPLDGGKPEFVKTGGRIQMDEGSVINVAGSTGVQVESSRNFLKVQLRGSELADSPLQRRGPVRGEDLVVDARIAGTTDGRILRFPTVADAYAAYLARLVAWIGTPLGNASGYANLIERTSSELTTRGGSVTLDAGNAVVMSRGSTIDVSGGWANYTGGKFSTSKLMYQGQVVDISQATPDRVYSGIVTGGDKTILGKTYKDAGAATVEIASKWGVAKVFTSPLDPTRKQYEAPYINGADGGSITIKAPSVALDGSLLGQTIAGPRQLRSTPVTSTLPAEFAADLVRSGKEADRIALAARLLNGLGMSSFTLSLASQSLINGAYVTVSPYAPSVIFSRTAPIDPPGDFSIDATGNAAPLTAARRSSVYLSPDLLGRDGFGTLGVFSHDGSILIPSGVTLNAGDYGSVTLEAAIVDVGGTILAPSGKINLKAALTPYTLAYPIPPASPDVSYADIMVIKSSGEKVIQYGPAKGGSIDFLRADGSPGSLPVDAFTPLRAGIVSLRPGSVVSAAGLITDDHPGSVDRFGKPTAPNGGEISIEGYRVEAQRGSLLDVSGGVHVPALGNVSYGGAGKLALTGGRDTIYPVIHGGSLSLGSTMRGFSGPEGEGGALSLTAPAIRIGGGNSDPRITVLDPAFFNQGGFSRFSLTGVGLEIANSKEFVPGVSLAPGIALRPRVLSQILARSDAKASLDPLLFPSLFRPAPSITLDALGLTDSSLELADKSLVIRGDLVIGTGSSITLDPQMVIQNGDVSARTGAITLSGDTVSVEGDLKVPGGSISITGAGVFPANLVFGIPPPSTPFVTVSIAPSVRLSTAGQALYAKDPVGGFRGRFGTVLPGGSISLSGNILAQRGSLLDASGASGNYDFFPYQLGITPSGKGREVIAPSTLASRIDSPGGSISLAGGEALFSDASLVARSGGPTASGGSLSVSSGRFYAIGEEKFPTDLNLSVGASRSAIPSGFEVNRSSAIGLAMPSADGIARGGGQIAASSFASGGFSHLTLNGNVLFNESVSLSLPGSIRLATGGLLAATPGSVLRFQSEYAALGRPFVPPLTPDQESKEGVSVFDPVGKVYFAPPTWGSGQLTVEAEVIDVGNLSLGNIGTARLDATGGAIRGNGTFAMAGNLTLKAAQVYPVTGTTFTAVAFNHDNDGVAVSSGGTKGSITVLPGGSAPLPLSALGSLSLQADTIIQSGTLVAPFGSITLGNLSTTKASKDPVSGLPSPITGTLKLTAGSVTSVSAIDQLTGLALSMPYGTSQDGTSWVDPSGSIITSTGLSSKKIDVNGANLVMEKGAVVDLQGGGAVTANHWVSGLGGKIDWLADNNPQGSFAIIPGYQAPYAPKGYGEGMLQPGSLVTLEGGAGLPAGTYTLLPASYATQPGAYLLTPSSQRGLAGTTIRPDGSVLVSGTRWNGLDASASASKITTLFELSSPKVLASKVEYRILNADTFFSGVPSSSRTADGGHLILQASASMNLAGAVTSAPGKGGRRGIIDIAGSSPMLVYGPSGPWETPAEGTILLDASVLSSWDTGSILIGGYRTPTGSGAQKLTPTTTSVTVDTGASLSAREIILAAAPKTYTVVKVDTPESVAEALGVDVTVEDLLAANQLASDATLTAGQILKVPGAPGSVTMAKRSALIATGGGEGSSLVVEGNGVLLHAGSAGTTVQRTVFQPNATDIDAATPLARLMIGRDVILSGEGVTLNSTSDAALSPLASINAGSLRVASGQITLNGAEPGALSLSGQLLDGLSSSRSLKSLSLKSYSTLMVHEGAVLGSDSLESLDIHAAAIRGYGGDARFAARNITLANGAGSLLPAGYEPEPGGGSLAIDGSVLTIGSGDLKFDGFGTIDGKFSGGIKGSGKGSFTTAGDLTISTPVIASAGGAFTSLTAGGDLVISSPGSGPGLLTPGIGSSLSITGFTVSLGSPVRMPSGSIAVTTTAGDLTISSLLDVTGSARSFPGVVSTTDAGTISLASQGNLRLAPGANLDLDADPKGGSAGSLKFSIPYGTLSFEPGSAFSAVKGSGGTDGRFTADLLTHEGGNLAGLQRKLTEKGFTASQNMRIRSGDVTVADVKARSYTLSADSGDITVTGLIDASGITGGSINLFAGRSVVLQSGSMLTVHGLGYDNAGKGGAITLEAGNNPDYAVISESKRDDSLMPFTRGESLIDLQADSMLDLGVTAAPDRGQVGGTLLLKAPQTRDSRDVQINPIEADIKNAPSIAVVGNNRIDAAAEGPVSIDPLPTWGGLAPGLAYLPGQSVIGDDGNVYRLTADPTAYRAYLAGDLADGIVPSESSYWTRTVAQWDMEKTYSAGDKVLGADGRIYTATDGYAPLPDKSLPKPGAEGSSLAWILLPDEGNLKQLALDNAAKFSAEAGSAFGGKYAASIHLRPGEEIVNSRGGLLLNQDWDLSRSRYGEHLYVLDAKEVPVPWSESGPTDSMGTYQMIGREPGLLSLRASGDITFHGSLSDGFGDSIKNAADVIAEDGDSRGLYFAPLLPLLRDTEGDSVSQQSWSYRITAGSDLSAADPMAFLAGTDAHVSVGRPGDPLPYGDSGPDAQQDVMINNSGLYQVLRTGTGDITITASGDVRLINPLSAIYTAGTRVTDPTLGGTFDTPVVYLQDQDDNLGSPLQGSIGSYPVQYASMGGNITITAGRDVTRLNALLDEEGFFQLFRYDDSGQLIMTAQSSRQMPSNWLYRRGSVDPKTGKFELMNESYEDGTIGNDVASTTWWVDYSNFFQDVGALGGGNIVMNAGRDVANVSASIPTSYRMRGKDGIGDPIAPSIKEAVELGGGNLSVIAGNNIDAGVYYVERGQGILKAGGSIITNPTRDPVMPGTLTGMAASDEAAWLPTTLFLGKGSFAVEANRDVVMGPVANVFLTPPGVNNSYWYKTYFSTYDPGSAVSVRSIGGDLTLRQSAAVEIESAVYPMLQLWFDSMTGSGESDNGKVSYYTPWVRTSELRNSSLGSLVSLMPPTLTATALAGDITLQGNLTTAPAPAGNISLLAAGGISGLTSAGTYTQEVEGEMLVTRIWNSATINLSDADPRNVPGAVSPLSKRSTLDASVKNEPFDNANINGANYFTDAISALFAESGSYFGDRAEIGFKSQLHDAGLLHRADREPLRLIANSGDISGLTLFSGKRAEILAAEDITDIAFHIQNLAPSDISIVSAGGDIRAYDPQSILRARALELGNVVDPQNIVQFAQDNFPSGDIQISGPGTLELMAGGEIDLGNAPLYSGDTTIWNGLTSIGNARNPALPFQGADLVVAAGLQLPRGLSSEGVLGLEEFTSKILSGEQGAYYLSQLKESMTYSGSSFPQDLTAQSFAPGSRLSAEEKALLQLQLFYIVLRETGRNYNKEGSPGYRNYKVAEEAIALLFRDSPGTGSVTTWSRDIRTKNGGNISIIAPGGGLTLASTENPDIQTTPGIVTETGGGINIFTRESVDIGIGRIFTLRGGDVMIWSDKGDIAAGSSAKTVASAPPTRVLIDPSSGDVQTDLAGLSTGGGIGVLATVKGIPPGNVDLIAPTGVIDAGDAGIRSTGNLNLAATRILNANNIAAGGTTSGAPPAPPPPAAPNVSGATAASAASAGNNASAQASTKPPSDQAKEEAPSVISVEVLGYGGGDAPVEEDEAKKSAGGVTPPSQASL